MPVNPDLAGIELPNSGCWGGVSPLFCRKPMQEREPTCGSFAALRICAWWTGRHRPDLSGEDTRNHRCTIVQVIKPAESRPSLGYVEGNNTAHDASHCPGLRPRPERISRSGSDARLGRQQGGRRGRAGLHAQRPLHIVCVLAQTSSRFTGLLIAAPAGQQAQRRGPLGWMRMGAGEAILRRSLRLQTRTTGRPARGSGAGTLAG